MRVIEGCSGAVYDGERAQGREARRGSVDGCACQRANGGSRRHTKGSRESSGNGERGNGRTSLRRGPTTEIEGDNNSSPHRAFIGAHGELGARCPEDALPQRANRRRPSSSAALAWVEPWLLHTRRHTWTHWDTLDALDALVHAHVFYPRNRVSLLAGAFPTLPTLAAGP